MSIRSYLQSARKMTKSARPARKQENQLRQRRQRFVRLGVERLEDRIVPAISGVPVWTPEGPAPVFNSDGTTHGAGAIEAIAVQPGNANNVYIGSVNGGIWHTGDATAANPLWTPQTDQMPSLSIGAVTFASWDASGNTLFAGFADTSSNNSIGGPLPGDILETTNGGANWSLVPINGLTGNNVNNIATTTDSSGHHVVLVASNGGLYRSTNGGATFQPDAPFNNTGQFSDVVVDPANPEVVYAASPSAKGFYESTNAGASFGAYNLSSFMSSTSLKNGVGNIKLAATESGGEGILYLDVLDPGGNLLGLFRLDNNLSNGDSSASQYSQLTNADQSAPDVHHISIAANLANPNEVYVGMSESGVWLVTASTASQVIGVDNSGTHGDSRHLAFDPNGDLLQADDGGLWRLHNPGPNQTWQAMDGNLNITEVYTVDYDATHKTIVGGAQDNGSFYQTSSGSLPQVVARYSDGGVVNVDNTSSGGPYYYITTGGGGFSIKRFTTSVNSSGQVVTSPSLVSLAVQNANKTIDQFDPSGGNFYISPWALNAVDPTRILVGMNYLYESVPGLNPANSNYSFVPMATNGQLGAVTTMAYGGWSGTTPMPDVAYVATSDSSGDNRLYVRSKIVNLDFTDFALTKYAGGRITAIALDPTNWQSVYVQSASGDVWHSSDTGQTWVDITKNLIQLGGNKAIIQGAHSLQVVNSNGTTPELLLGDGGGLFLTNNPTALNSDGTSAAVWVPFMGSNLPRTPVSAVHYYPGSDLLVVATHGRGVWTLSGASNYLGTNTSMIITHNALTSSDTVRLALDPSNLSLLDVFQNNTSSTPNAVMPIALLDSVIIEGLNKQENLIIDNSNGTVNVPDGIYYYGGSLTSSGGTNFATLTINDTNATTADTLTENDTQIKWQLAGYAVTGNMVLFNVGTVDLDSSPAGTTFNALATDAGVVTNLVSEGLAVSKINVGINGNVQGIQGVLNLRNPPSYNDIVVNDSNDPNIQRSVVLGNGPAPDWGTLTGLAPAAINFAYTDTSSVTVDLPNAFHFSGQTNTDLGSSITVTPVSNVVYNINGNPNLLAPGNSLIVSNANGTVVDHHTGTYAGNFTFQNSSTALVNYTGIQTPIPIGLLVASTDAGVSPEVKVYTAQTGALLYDLHPFKSNFLGGIRVAVGDLNGDGVPDILAAEGPGSSSDGDSLIQVFDGSTGQQLAGPLGQLDPFPGFSGGLWVAAADLTGSGFADLIVGQGAGGQGWVNVYNGQTGALLTQFQPYGGSFTDGVRVAAGPVTSNGDVDVVTGAGPGGPPLVNVYDGPNLVQGIDTPVASFDAFTPSFTGGVYVATGLISGQGKPPADIIVGEGAGGEPRISVFDGTGTQLQSFLAFDPSFQGGVRVAAADVNGSGRSAIVAAQGPGTGSSPQVSAFDGVSLQPIDNFTAFPANGSNGLFVAGGGRWGLFREVNLPTPPPSQPPGSLPPSTPPTPTPTPTLNAPLLVTLFDLLLGGIKTVNADGSVTVTDSLFGFPLLVSTFDLSGNLEHVTWLGFDVTLLFELL